MQSGNLIMTSRSRLRLFSLLAVLVATPLLLAARPRLAVLTDIGGDPDDQQSMIRLLVYANELDLELLMATAVRTNHTPEGPSTRPQLIHQLIDAYHEVLPNLRRHADGWPAADALRGVVVSGNPRYGRDFIGDGHDTPGSQALIDRIDAGSAEQPLNVSVWGGQTDLAQALWRVKRDRGASGFAVFVRKLRVFDVDDQDVLAGWMRTEFPGLHYILTRTHRDENGKRTREGTYRGMYVGGDLSLTSRAWVDANILSRGPLGVLYPTKTWTVPNPHRCLKEGDTLAWFFFLPRGGNDPADPTKPGWGGRYRRTPDGWYEDVLIEDGTDPIQTVNRWRPEFQRNFAQRMVWCLPR